MTAATRFLVVALGAAGSCGQPLPDDVMGYETRCVRLNVEPLQPYDGDPHRGLKNVFACNVDRQLLRSHAAPPYPEGTLMVKESRRPGESFVWLIATARKHGAGWTWDEYTRNFDDEEPRRSLGPQSNCTGCHGEVKAADWIFTHYSGD